MLNKQEMLKKLQSALSNKRYIHTLGVAEEAVKLAGVHGANADKAETAALLHDCAKSMPDALKLRLCREYHIPLNDAMLSQPDITHSFLGAEIASREYAVFDEEILDAVRYHTTARPKMGILEKIIYLADFFEPNRTPYDSMDKIKELAYLDLDKALEFSLGKSVIYIGEKGHVLHPLTLDALSYYKALVITKEKEENLGH